MKIVFGRVPKKVIHPPERSEVEGCATRLEDALRLRKEHSAQGAPTRDYLLAKILSKSLGVFGR